MKIKYEAEVKDCRDCILLEFGGFMINPEHIGEVQPLWECRKTRYQCFTMFPCQKRPCSLVVKDEV